MTESKVDVLYDMRDGAATLGAAKQEPAALRLLDAHDAVAELIEACEPLEELWEAGCDMDPYIQRLAAALAACTPAKSEGR